MNKILKNIIIYAIIGIVLGTITEFALIFNFKNVVKITQSFLFWGIIMMLTAIITKEYKHAIIYSIILMLTMNSMYYIIRLIKSGYTNTGNWNMFNFIAIGGTLFITTFIFIIKDIFKKKKDYFKILNLILMIILGIVFVIFNISLGLRFNNLVQYASLGIIVAFFITLLVKGIYKKKEGK